MRTRLNCYPLFMTFYVNDIDTVVKLPRNKKINR